MGKKSSQFSHLKGTKYKQMNAKRLSMVCFVCSYTLTTHIPDIWLHLVEQRDKYEAFLKELKKKWNS